MHFGGGTTWTGTFNGDYNIWQESEGHASTNAGESNSLYSQDFSTGMFANYASQDYKVLSSLAPQNDVADATYAPADDYLDVARPQGNADDIGPYEFLADDGQPPQPSPLTWATEPYAVGETSIVPNLVFSIGCYPLDQSLCALGPGRFAQNGCLW